MLVKVMDGSRMVIAICDKNLFGKKFEEGKKQLDLTGDFFKGEEMTVEEVKEVMKTGRVEDASFNIVGTKSCGLAKKMGLIVDSGIKVISGVPCSLVLF
jgi:hypothetical protein